LSLGHGGSAPNPTYRRALGLATVYTLQFRHLGDPTVTTAHGEVNSTRRLDAESSATVWKNG